MSNLSLQPIEHKSITARKISVTAVTNRGTATVTTTEPTAAKPKTKLSKFATLKSHNKAQDLVTIQQKETATSNLLKQSTTILFLPPIPILNLDKKFPGDCKKPTLPQHLEHLTRSKAVFERKRRRRCKNQRSCSIDKVKVADTKDEKLETDDREPMLKTDVEVFQGKIVFNVDGNSFIIATENSTQDLILNSKAVQETTESKQFLTTNVVGKTGTTTQNLTSATVATATKATTLSTTSTTLEKSLASQDGKGPDALKSSVNPRIHSFRIVSAQDATTANVANTTTTDKNSVEKTEFATPYIEHQQQQRRRYSNFDDNDNDSDSSNGNNITERSSKIQKPILMCFICKLSFGNTKSFSLHANAEHQLTLQPKEQHLLNREYSSVIIQPQNMDQRPQISFLEPIDVLNVIKNDNLNSETDIQFKECTSHVFSCGIDSAVDSSMSEKLTPGRIISENSDKPAPLSSNSNSVSPSILSSPSPMASTVPTTTQTALSPSQITSTMSSSAIEYHEDSNLLLTTSFSKCMLQAQRYEASDTEVTTASAVKPPLSSTKFDTSEQQQQQKIKENVAIESIDRTESKVQSASISPSLISSIEIKLSSTPPLLSKSELENITELDESYSMDTRTATGAVSCASSDVQVTPGLIVCPIPTSKNTATTSDMVNNDTCGLYTGDIPSPPMTTVGKTHDEMLELSALTINAPTTHGDFVHLQMSSATVSAEGNGLDPTDALAETVNFLQQRHNATMTSNSFATPQPALVSIGPTHTHLSCLHASLAALSDDRNANCNTTEAQKTNAKLLTNFLQQHLNLQQQKTYSNTSSNCPEQTDYKNSDCKNCEIPQLRSSPYHQLTNNMSQCSPSRNNGSCTSKAIMQSPAHMATSPKTTAVNVSAAVVAAAASTQQQNAAAAVAVAAAAAAAAAASVAAASVATNTSSFTIGACSDHINGRPLGVECARCEIILNSTRLNTGVQMSTRNSCKTLKCPQCNWHYKYQETLEIHMREKHPDGESACGYCLSGQQHPRLARGESYSCGYKPYRCEICNYSTTTKGNLSIHMQSDKHLNNMQELNSSQSMLVAAVAAVSSGKADVASKMLLSKNASAAQQQQQKHQQQQAQQTLPQAQSQQPQSTLVASSSMVSTGGPSVNVSDRTSVDGVGSNCNMLNKNKPSFRCDICSYETSVARNLRIHMTSEKHTHNVAALQNNIKHIQAYSFLQQHQQAVAAHQQQQLAAATQTSQSQVPPLTSGLANSFLPEIALADFAYNQAIMIQLLQNNSVGQQQQHHESVTKMQVKTSPSSSPRSMQIEQQSTIHQQHQFQQLRQQLQQSYSPNNSSSTLLLSADFGTSDTNLSSNVGGSCSNDETLEPPIHADPYPTSLYTCLVCDVFGTNSLDELNQHLLIDRSRSCNKTTATNAIGNSCIENVNVTNTTNNNDVMIILNNNYICRLCNYKTNLKANFQLHSKTDKHLQKLNYINHIREGGSHNEYKLKYLQLSANTVQLKCNSCDFYTNSIQKLSLHTQHMRHDKMRMIFQHLLRIMEQHNFGRNKIVQTQLEQQLPPHSKTHPLKDANEIVPSIRGSQSVMPTKENNGSDTNPSSSIAVEDMPESMQKSLTCQLCDFSTFTLLNMIQHVKSMRHIQIEQFVNLQRRSEQLDPPGLDDIFKIVERPALQSLALTVAATQGENNRIGNVSTTSVLGYFPLPPTRLSNDDFGCITSSTDQNSFSPSSNSSTASGNTSVRSKNYQSVNIFNFQTASDEKDASSSALPGGSPVAMPSVVFKCNNCDFFAQSKTEMELHLSAVHPQTEPDYISIPTNSAAIQAFQAAVAAATAAAASAVTATRAPSNKSYSENYTTNDDCPDIIKREQLGTPEEEETLKFADVQSKMLLQDVSTITPWLSTSANTISINETSTAMVQSKTIHNVSREFEKTGEQKEQQIEGSSKDNALIENCKKNSGESINVQCPLCTDTFDSKQTLETHLMNVHSVNRDGLSRLLQLVDTSAWHLTSSTSIASTIAEDRKSLNIASETTTNQTITVRESPSTTSKTNESPKVASSPLPANVLQDQQQQQDVASFNAAFLNQSTLPQQRQLVCGDELIESGGITSGHLMPHVQIKPRGYPLTQKYLEQQSLQNLQQLPQFTAAVATSGLQLNPVEMFNLMQFHHIMSMNFMNLAPPLIFGVGTNSGSSGNVDLLTHTHIPKVAHNPSDNTVLCGSEISVPGTPVVPTAGLIATSQQQLQSQSQQSAPTSTAQVASNQKRARTRITDDQLKILRAHFDINNSPSEESIMEMSQKANLPMKVVKHWFRNTLFKERQRNKDSPYNFNNPPSTTLNLEEYERTGQAKVTPLNEDLHMTSFNSMQQQQNQNIHESNPKNNTIEKATIMPDISGDSPLLIEFKSEPFDDNTTTGSPHRQNKHQQQELRQQEQHKENEKDLLSTSSALLLHKRQQHLTALSATEHQQQVAEVPDNTAVETAVVTALHQRHQQQQHFHGQSNQNSHQQQPQHINLYSYETKSESGSSDILSRPQSPNNSSTIVPTHYASINELLNQQLDNLPLSQNLNNINVVNMHGNNMGPPKNFQTNKSFDKNSPSSQFDTNSNSSNASSTSSGKRANRTRFTDYQIKVLQEFFENNSYPKDSDLEYLSKLLLLSPRVIVVWFQNARQKQRKIYENQPNNSHYETEEKKHNINYACKKCNMAFQRYYELIRHQKNHCFKEENNKKSAKAQIAAAQIAQNLSSEDSNSSMDINNSSAYQLQHQHVSAATITASLSNTANVSNTSPGSTVAGINMVCNTSPQHLFGISSMSMTDFSPSTTPTPPQTQRERSDSNELLPQGQEHKAKFECEKCKLQFSYYEHFREHQLLHLMYPSLFTAQIPNIPEAYSSFGSILQSLQHVAAASASHQQHHQFLQHQDQPPAKKRKCSETSSIADDVSSIGGTGDGEISNISFSISNSKRYEFLYQYFMQNENDNELKQQFQAQQKQSHEPEIEMEYLRNFYHQCELRKRSNYDFLYQYYQKNEHTQQVNALPSQAGFFGSENKPNIDVLLQYYQLNESKKFFQLDASNQEINDHKAASPTSASQYQHVNNPISISSSDDTTTPRVDITDTCSMRNSLDARNSSTHFPDCDNDNNDNETNSNGCGMDVDDAETYTDTDDHIIDNIQIYANKSRMNVTKSSNVNDNADNEHVTTACPIEVANKLAKISQINEFTTSLQSQFSYGNEQHKLQDLSTSLGRCEKGQKHNLTKCKASNVSSKTILPINKTKATTSTNYNSAYIDNLNDFIHVNQKSESKGTSKQQQHYNDLLQVQNETDDRRNNGLALPTIDRRQLAETPISSPKSTTNSNNNPTVGSSNTTTKTVTGITEKQQNKRLRTTILPEQLNFLYECYQNESNPSRKMLEEIAKKVNLKKRVVQVWFQNSRAKDKKSRNQRFTAISDDSNYEDASQNNRDYVLFQKNSLKSTKIRGSKGNINFLPDANTSNNSNTGVELGDCNLCQMSQVNIQQHSLSIEHIYKVKKLLEQNAVDVKLNIDSEVFSTAVTVENKKYRDKQSASGQPNTNVDLNEDKYVTGDENAPKNAQDDNFKTHVDTDVAGSDRLGTFTRIYKELKLQNTMKQTINFTCNNQNSEIMEWHDRSNINNESEGATTADIGYDRCKGQQQQQFTQQASGKNFERQENETIINTVNKAENVDSTDNISVNGNGNDGKYVLAQDYQHYNKLSNIVNHKVMEAQFNINDSERSSKSDNFFPNAPLATIITVDDDNYMDELKDSSGGNALDLNDNTETIQNSSTRNETITANSNSTSTSCSLTTNTSHTQLTKAHAKDIIQQLYNCNQITDKTINSQMTF